MVSRVSRRTFLLGAVGTAVLAATGSVVAIEDGVLPGRTRLAALTGACDVDAVPPAGPAGTVTSGQFASSARGRDVGWSVALPPGHGAAEGLPMALVLHGRGGDHSTGFTQLRLHEFLAAYVRMGGTPFALAAADGGAVVRAAFDEASGVLGYDLWRLVQEGPEDQLAAGAELVKEYHVGDPQQLTNCSTCHR